MSKEYEEYIPTEQAVKDQLSEGYSEFIVDLAIAKIKAGAWQEGYDEFERAHNMSNYEPWEYVGDNPYEVQA